MGLSVSDAVRILLKRVVSDQAFPLELKVPNAQTCAAMEEARAMRHDALHKIQDTLRDSPHSTRKPTSEREDLLQEWWRCSS